MSRKDFIRVISTFLFGVIISLKLIMTSVTRVHYIAGGATSLYAKPASISISVLTTRPKGFVSSRLFPMTLEVRHRGRSCNYDLFLISGMYAISLVPIMTSGITTTMGRTILPTCLLPNGGAL